MSYNQPDNQQSPGNRPGNRQAGSRQSGNHQQDSRERERYGRESSHQAANYDVPRYDPSTDGPRERAWNEGRQDEGYLMDQDFTHNRDYRSIQQDHFKHQDHANHQADYSLGDRERNDWEQRHQDWDRPQQSRGYRSAQFSGRQSTFEQRPHDNGSEFGNVSSQYGRAAEYPRAQRWAGDRSYGANRNQYREQEGYYPPQGGGWQQRQPSLRDSGYDNADFGDSNVYGGGYVQQDAGFQGWLDRGFQGNHQGDQQAFHYSQQSFRGRAPKGYERSDERVKEDLCERLTHDHQIDASEITVTVKAGVVTLEGSIANRNQKYRAEDLADNISGVKDVQNRLSIMRLSQQSTEQSTQGVGSSGGTTLDTGRGTQASDLAKTGPQNVTRQ